MISSKPIRVLIVDDHAMVRSGLRMFLMAFEDLELAGEAMNGIEAVRLAGLVKPDVILMDLIMPGMDGIRATAQIRKLHPQVRIIALTSFTDSNLIHEALEAGVSGYLFKDASAAELASAIRATYAGHSILSPEVTQALLVYTAPPPDRLNIDLTGREKEVLTLMVEGKTNAEISEALTLSLSTVKFHVSNILSKLDAKSRGQAILFSIKHHLTDFPNRSEKE
ncbi:MAG TPA: response regulator transcription factor [Anaerolineaceae bacterium]|nr:response regulator transcription factor [Anaerolineaceae bacterium]